MVSGKPSGPYFLKEDRVITEMKNGPNILLTSRNTAL